MSETKAIDDLLYDATTWLDTLSQRDADVFINELLDRVIALLRHDPGVPARTYEQWLLLLADVAERSRDELGRLIEGKGDIDEAVGAISDAFSEFAGKKKSRRNVEEARR